MFGQPHSIPRDSDPGLRAAILGSGSAGNSIVVGSESGYVLLDAGFSCRELERRLQGVGVATESLRAVVLTHEHGDHCRGAERLARVYDLPLFATRGTLEGCRFSQPRKVRLVPISSGVPFMVDGLEVEAFPVSHDAREPVGLVVADGRGRRLGLVSDLGSSSETVRRRLRGVDILVHETNHDLEMLRTGPYPWSLKRRVASDRGHLSNQAAADDIHELVGERLRWIVLYHLSRTNNLPALAARAVSEVLNKTGSDARVVLTCQTEATSWLEVST